MFGKEYIVTLACKGYDHAHKYELLQNFIINIYGSKDANNIYKIKY